MTRQTLPLVTDLLVPAVPGAVAQIHIYRVMRSGTHRTR